MAKHLIESQQFTKELLFKLFKRAEELRISPSDSLKGKVLTTLFYEPSTRTRLSFESAMLKMGGQIMGTENAREFSSVSKGESLADTIRVIASYSDAIVMRHNEEGSAEKASQVSNVPIINGGDGKGQHPTQALLDVYTIHKEIGRLDNIKIAMVGDLTSGRTVQSLCYLFGKFSGVQIIFISPENLKINQNIKDYLERHNIKFTEEDNLEKILPTIDIVYMTRIQKERISPKDYEKAKGKFIINDTNLELIPKDARIMHPLPHVEEIDISLYKEQNDPRVAYFRQAENGLYIRMALLEQLIPTN
ncbi:aspartate carbamoyltransferase [Candidatus Pacearchaeota archaeon]|nr:aspartate carbamoyltransferase [Candidatus Pacearchaeota archaeon]